MNELLKKTLDCIAIENGDFEKSFDLVKQIVENYGEVDLANHLYCEIDLVVDWKVIADLFSILIWSTSDNGFALTRTTDGWITECEDERKIKIALDLDVYPFFYEKEMQVKLENAAKKFPSLSSRCNDLIKTRNKENAK